MNYTKEEFAKRDDEMMNEIDYLRKLIDSAENQDNRTIDGTWYPVSHTWREVAKIALNLADEEEWMTRCENKLEVKKDESTQKNNQTNYSCTQCNRNK
ncbi:hypothetical protein OZX58_03130 [Lactobacillus sp. ESL0680]|uniref:hypothetical protein n=1 Tax=Lactobacillus sp. ESL0680 TaxID=2983210 RepID=UPI0023FA0D19|nr:hypothetical protein [Lactobacillus sp. ESL0680]WEV39243.1 hypothetical protein OZX58_03130 [Lactobacillus sp. ESL0680]